MDVFLIPVAAQQYELYCEPADDAEQHAYHAEPVGRFKGVWHRFQQTLHQIERRHPSPDDTAAVDEGLRWTQRLRARGLRWLAEKVAEQRLLWRLRDQNEATAFFPSDLPEADAAAVVRQTLRRDAERHRFWLVIDSIVFVVSGVLVWIPGPNVLAYYFAFRMIGHYLSMGGARQGLDRTTWRYQASAELAELRGAAALTAAARAEQVGAVAVRLNLPHLERFFRRIALPDA